MGRSYIYSTIGLFISALIVTGLLIHPITVEIDPLACSVVSIDHKCRLYTNTTPDTTYYGGTVSCRDGTVECYPYMTIINHHATISSNGYYEYRINVTDSKYQAQFEDSMDSLMFGMSLVLFSMGAAGCIVHLIYVGIRMWRDRKAYVTIESADLEEPERETI